MNDNIIKGERKIARKLREWYPGAIYHLMHRGVRRTEIFSDETDYQVFLEILKVALDKYQCKIHAYCMMTNHIHLLLETSEDEIGRFMKCLSERYAMYFNHKYQYRGHLFESIYKSCLVNGRFLFLTDKQVYSSEPGESQNSGKTRGLPMEQLSDNDCIKR